MEASQFPEDRPATVGAGPDLVDAGAIPARSPWELFWRRFKEDRLALAALVFVAILILIAMFAPLVVEIAGAPGPDERDTEALDPFFATPTGPSADHLFGVDQIGRDVFSPDHLRRPGIAGRRVRGDDHRHRGRHRHGPPRRLLPRLDRHPDLAQRRRPAGDPVPAAGDRPRGGVHRRRHRRQRRRLLRRPDQARGRGGHLRHLVHELDLHGAHRPRPDAVPAREGVRRGGPRRRRLEHPRSSSARSCRT